jgi:anthraniloyl-CoA monooxygenase
MRFPLEVVDAVRRVWPSHKPLAARISASDWLDEEGGFTLAEAVELSKALKAAGCDLIDVSSAGNSPRSKPEYGRMYQVGFAERIRFEALVPVMTVGGVMSPDHVNSILAAGRADLCAVARAHLADPYFTLRAGAQYGYDDAAWPTQYLAAKPR